MSDSPWDGGLRAPGGAGVAGPTGPAGPTGATGPAGPNVPGMTVLIASAIGVDLNALGDTVMTLSSFAAGHNYLVDYVLVTNPSVPVASSVVAGVWQGAGATGQSYTGSYTTEENVPLSNYGNFNNPLDFVILGGRVSVFGGFLVSALTGNGWGGTSANTPPIVNVSGTQGSPATVDFYVYGRLYP